MYFLVIAGLFDGQLYIQETHGLLSKKTGFAVHFRLNHIRPILLGEIPILLVSFSVFCRVLGSCHPMSLLSLPVLFCPGPLSKKNSPAAVQICDHGSPWSYHVSIDVYEYANIINYKQYIQLHWHYLHIFTLRESIYLWLNPKLLHVLYIMCI